jgi:ABC-type Fe3+ transport system permease subunit
MWLSVVVFLLSIPAGFLLAWMARDELIIGRKWFLLLGIVSILLGIAVIFYDWITIMWTCLFILVVCVISYGKSYSTRWTKIKDS